MRTRLCILTWPDSRGYFCMQIRLITSCLAKRLDRTIPAPKGFVLRINFSRALASYGNQRVGNQSNISPGESLSDNVSVRGPVISWKIPILSGYLIPPTSRCLSLVVSLVLSAGQAAQYYRLGFWMKLIIRHPHKPSPTRHAMYWTGFLFTSCLVLSSKSSGPC
jgi:hypothetical protein